MTIPALSYLALLRNAPRMSQRLDSRASNSFLAPEIQEALLERRCALLAKRHIKDTEEGKDTSYDVFQLTMAHADLTYWRGLRSQIRHAPKQHEATIKALVNVVSTIS